MTAIEPLDQDAVDSLFALYASGDFGELARRTAELSALYPGALVLHSLLAAARCELGDYEAAIESYRAALRIRPEFAKAHNGIGVAHLRLGELDAATRSFRAAVEIDPGFAGAHFNLGIVRERQADWRRAAEHYREAVRHEPRHVAAWTALGLALWRLGEHGSVVDAFERALALAPAHRPAQRGLLGFLEQANRHDELRAALARARAALGGTDALIALHEGILADIDGATARSRDVLESIAFAGADAASQHDERQRRARLARICDRQGEPAAAMRHARAANELSRRIAARQGIDGRRFSAFVENRRRYFASCEKPPWPRNDAITTDAAPVFLLGFPRSGTTLLDVMLRGHPGIDVGEETDAVAAMVGELAGPADERLEGIGDLQAGELERVRRLYFDRLLRGIGPRKPASVLIDRFALNVVYAGEIQRVFPGARFILMLRHPADCVLSCFLQTFHETSANAHFYTLEDAADLYGRVFELWTLCRDKLDLDVIEVRYERLVADPEASCRDLLARLRIPWHAGALDHERTARARPFIKTVSYDQVIRPIYASAVERWRRYAAEMKSVLPTLAPWIERFGYRA